MNEKQKFEPVDSSLLNEVDSSRRTLALSFLGALGGLAFVNGCATLGTEGSSPRLESEDHLASNVQSLVGLSALAWVDTILRLPLVGGTTPRSSGDLATNTAASLKAEIVVAKGCVAPGDGGGGIFFWSTTGVDDGGTVIVPNKNVGSSGATGCWRRLYLGAVNVKWFGATGNGTTDDSAAVINALKAVNAVGGGSVFFPAGVYMVHDIELYSNITIFGEGDASILKTTKDIYICVSTNPRDGGDVDVASNKRNITIRDLKFVGTVATDGFQEHLHLLWITAASNVLVERCSFVGFRGDGIMLGSGDSGRKERHNENITIRECFFDGVNNENRQGISIVDGTNVLIENNYFTRCTKRGMPGAIDIEPNWAYSYIVNIKILNNTFTNIGGGGVISMYLSMSQAEFMASSKRGKPMNGLTIRGNFIDSCTSGRGIAITQRQTANASTYPNDITIEDNSISNGAGGGIIISGIRQATILNNKITNVVTDPVFLGAAITNGGMPFPLSVYEILFADNYMYQCDTQGGAGMHIGWANYVKVCRNTFDSLGKPDASPPQGYALDFASNSTSSHITIEDNLFIAGGRTRHGIVREATHTLTPLTNQFRNNDLGGLSNWFLYTSPGSVLEVQIAIDVPSISSGKTYLSSSITVPGADIGDYVHVACGEDLKGMQLSGYVSAKDTINCTLTNNTGVAVDLPHAIYSVKVTKK